MLPFNRFPTEILLHNNKNYQSSQYTNMICYHNWTVGDLPEKKRKEKIFSIPTYDIFNILHHGHKKYNL